MADFGALVQANSDALRVPPPRECDIRGITDPTWYGQDENTLCGDNRKREEISLPCGGSS